MDILNDIYGYFDLFECIHIYIYNHLNDFFRDSVKIFALSEQ